MCVQFCQVRTQRPGGHAPSWFSRRTTSTTCPAWLKNSTMSSSVALRWAAQQEGAGASPDVRHEVQGQVRENSKL